MYSLDNEFIDSVLACTIPSFQLTCKKTRNLGFGGVFYALVRTLRPQRVAVIGSKAGFAPIMFAKALKDNEGHGISRIDCEEVDLQSPKGKTELHFIDPSYSLHREDAGHWYGLGNWDDPQKVSELWRKFGVEDVVEHFKMTPAEYLANSESSKKIDVLYVDGDHSYEGVTHDFVNFHEKLSDDGMVLAHDVDPSLEEGGGYRAFNDLSDRLYEKTRLPIYPGLAIMRKKPAAKILG